jgi:hypothetical protein
MKTSFLKLFSNINIKTSINNNKKINDARHVAHPSKARSRTCKVRPMHTNL